VERRAERRVPCDIGTRREVADEPDKIDEVTSRVFRHPAAGLRHLSFLGEVLVDG
jgi:hypothetical protein